LKHALTDASRWHLLARNPAETVDPPKVSPKPMETYDMVQTAMLIEAMRPTRMLIPTVLAVLCGLRRGEIAALRWRNVDLETGSLSVVESAEQTKAGIRFKEPKSGKTRNVRLADTVIEELNRWRRRQAEELLRVGLRPDGDTFVVTQADGSSLQPRSITHEWMRLLAAKNCRVFASTTFGTPTRPTYSLPVCIPRSRANAWAIARWELHLIFILMCYPECRTTPSRSSISR
jgi:integrase